MVVLSYNLLTYINKHVQSDSELCQRSLQSALCSDNANLADFGTAPIMLRVSLRVSFVADAIHKSHENTAANNIKPILILTFIQFYSPFTALLTLSITTICLFRQFYDFFG